MAPGVPRISSVSSSAARSSAEISTAGIDALSAPDHRKRTLGRALLVQLLRSSLATDDDRAVAVGVLDADATYNPATGGDLRVIVPGSELDETRLLREDEQDNTPEGEQP